MLKDIYFYNAKALATDLRDDAVTECRAVKHLVASIILGGISYEVPITVTPNETGTSAFQTISYVVVFVAISLISYYGVWLTYQVNNKGDGKDYFLRFAALSLPVGIQLVVLFFVVSLVLVVLSFSFVSILGGFGEYLITLIFYLTSLVFTFMFFARMRNFLAIASGLNE